MVHASDIKPLANLVLTQPCAVIFTLPAANVDEVREALRRGSVEVTAFDQDNKVALSTGTLLLIDNAIDPATATIRLKAMFANVDDVLWPGEFVNARVLVETATTRSPSPMPRSRTDRRGCSPGSWRRTTPRSHVPSRSDPPPEIRPSLPQAWRTAIASSRGDNTSCSRKPRS